MAKCILCTPFTAFSCRGFWFDQRLVKKQHIYTDEVHNCVNDAMEIVVIDWDPLVFWYAMAMPAKIR